MAISLNGVHGQHVQNPVEMVSKYETDHVIIHNRSSKDWNVLVIRIRRNSANWENAVSSDILIYLF